MRTCYINLHFTYYANVTFFVQKWDSYHTQHLTLKECFDADLGVLDVDGDVDEVGFGVASLADVFDVDGYGYGDE